MEFEKLLAQEKRTMDGFRIREIRDVLTLEELKERVDTVDLLFTTIEVRISYTLLVFFWKIGVD